MKLSELSLPEQKLTFTLSNTNQQCFFAIKTKNNKIIYISVVLLTKHAKLYEALSGMFIHSISLTLYRPPRKVKNTFKAQA